LAKDVPSVMEGGYDFLQDGDMKRDVYNRVTFFCGEDELHY